MPDGSAPAVRLRSKFFRPIDRILPDPNPAREHTTERTRSDKNNIKKLSTTKKCNARDRLCPSYKEDIRTYFTAASRKQQDKSVAKTPVLDLSSDLNLLFNALRRSADKKKQQLSNTSFLPQFEKSHTGSANPRPSSTSRDRRRGCQRIVRKREIRQTCWELISSAGQPGEAFVEDADKRDISIVSAPMSHLVQL